jgi:hypothetical protein
VTKKTKRLEKYLINNRAMRNTEKHQEIKNLLNQQGGDKSKNVKQENVENHQKYITSK